MFCNDRDHVCLKEIFKREIREVKEDGTGENYKESWGHTTEDLIDHGKHFEHLPKSNRKLVNAFEQKA